MAKNKAKSTGTEVAVNKVPRNRVKIKNKSNGEVSEYSFDWYVEKFPKQFRHLETVEEFFYEIESLMRKSAVSWIKIGLYLDEARKKLGKQAFEELCQTLGLNPKATAWRYRKMARHPWLSNPKNWPHLPANQAALLMIAKHEQELTPKVLDQLVREEELHPATEPRDIKAWLSPPDIEEKEVRYKPIGKSVAIKLGGVPPHITEKDWKEFDKALKQAYKAWLAKVSAARAE